MEHYSAPVPRAENAPHAEGGSHEIPAPIFDRRTLHPRRRKRNARSTGPSLRRMIGFEQQENTQMDDPTTK